MIFFFFALTLSSGRALFLQESKLLESTNALFL